ncbi:MAG: phosphoribosyltransferase [Syntrophomonadaceae bacterium]
MAGGEAGIMLFANRREAGELLTVELKKRNIKFDVILAVPRGGVIIADAIAAGFNCEMDVIIAKKIGSPDLPEYAVGAVAPDGEVLIHDKIHRLETINENQLQRMAAAVQKEINYRLNLYRSYKSPVNITHRKVLVVDDGIASGFTMRAAVKYLRRQKVSEIIMAVPVTSYQAYKSLSQEVDEIIVLVIPDQFLAVGPFYRDFSPVEDRDVVRILQKLRSKNIEA